MTKRIRVTNADSMTIPITVDEMEFAGGYHEDGTEILKLIMTHQIYNPGDMMEFMLYPGRRFVIRE